MFSRIVALLMLLVSMMLLGVLGYNYYLQGSELQKLKAFSEIPKFVKVERPQAIEVKQNFSTHGHVRSKKQIALTTQLDGKIDQVHVQSGDSVIKSQPIISLDTSVERAEKASVESRLENAKKTLSRLQAVYDADKGVSKERLDNASTSVETLTADRAKINAIIAKKTVVASFDGVVNFKTLMPGRMVQAGEVLGTLLVPDQLEAWVYVPQVKASNVAVGHAFEFYPSIHGAFSGVVRSLQHVLEDSNLLVKGDFKSVDTKQLKPGMQGKVQVFYGEPKKTLVLPQSAIQFGISESLIYVVEEKNGSHYVRRKQIKLGEMIDGNMEINGKVDAQTLVVVEGLSKITDGDQVDFEAVSGELRG